MVSAGQLRAYRTGHRYYGVGTPDRLRLAEKFLLRKPAVILDRDGVLNRRPGPTEYVTDWGEWQWLDGALESLHALHEAGYQVVVASNQAGVARGFLSTADLLHLDRRMKEEARQAGGSIDASYYCPHGWNEGCQCRKPLPGMLFQAQRDLHLDLSRTWFIGDDERDQAAAGAAGCLYQSVSPTRGLRELVTRTCSRANPTAATRSCARSTPASASRRCARERARSRAGCACRARSATS
jgi:D-glycero-D-manno-heptose 1,7-bisphosphate phosphatase